MNEFTLPSDVEALFITNPTNIYYLTGFNGLAAPGDRESYLFIVGSHTLLLTYSMYRKEAEEVVKHHKEITPVYLSRDLSLLHAIQNTHKQYPFSRLGVESESLLLSEYRNLSHALPTVAIIEKTQWIEQKRIIKSPDEIQVLKQACELTDACFTHIQTLFTDGVSEKDIAWEIESYIKKHDGELSFPPIVAFNEHSATPHHLADTTTTLTKPTLILLDFGAKIQGYHADMTRVLFWGKPKPEWKKAYTDVKKAKEVAHTYIQSTPHPSGKKADALTRETLTSSGYETYPHGLGHGVGLAIHEDPRLSSVRDDQLLPHMVFTIEPAVYIPDQFGIRLEDTVVLTENGLTTLTTSPLLELDVH